VEPHDLPIRGQKNVTDDCHLPMEFGNIGIAVLLLLFPWAIKLIWNVIDHRRLVRKFPGPRGHSMIWGHARILAEVVPL